MPGDDVTLVESLRSGVIHSRQWRLPREVVNARLHIDLRLETGDVRQALDPRKTVAQIIERVRKLD